MKLIISSILILLLTIVNPILSTREFKTGDIRVHIIAHSHCDSGWTSTYDEYYSRQVRSIISTMVEGLNVETNPPRKFVWSEIGFLETWWDSVPTNLKNDFIKHVKNDRIEFINGGWVMNDEACPSAESVIRQLSNGHKFIREKFGKQPENGWQIDPFGHSSFTPTIQAQFGYKHMVLNRIHYELKEKFKAEKNLQFRWRGSPEALGPKSDILAHVFDDFYVGPPHFNFDSYNFQAYGLPRLVKELIELGNNRSEFYKSPHVLIPIGGDFSYRNAIKSFQEMDQIFAGVNQKYESGESNVQVQYSTLADFFGDTVKWHNDNNVDFNYYDGDFFPYADNFDNYWTGYYTSRPLLKGYERYVSSKLRSAEIYTAFSTGNEDKSVESLLTSSSKQVSILQHHDAITGTSKSHVVDDYFSRLSKSDTDISTAAEKSLAHALSPKKPTTLTTIDIGGSLTFNDQLDHIPFIVVNQLSWMKHELVTIKVVSEQDDHSTTFTHCPYVLAVDSIENEIEMDCSPRTDINSPDHKEYIQIDFPSLNKPMSSRLYILKRKVDATKSGWISPVLHHVDSISNHLLKVNLNEDYLIKSIEQKGEKEMHLNQQLLSYLDTGGAYVFRNNEKIYRPDRKLYSTFTYLGKFYQEAQSTLQDQLKTKYGWGGYYSSRGFVAGGEPYNGYSFNSVKLINVGNEMIDKKVSFTFHIKGINGTTTVNKFSTDIVNDREIYSDNGLEMMRRVSTSKNPPIVGQETQSYYPSINIQYIESKVNGQRLICNNDRSRGISSQCQGCMEMALHRSLTYEDGKGLEIPAIDESPINARFECYLGYANKVTDMRKQSINFQHKFQIFQGIDENKMGSYQFQSKALPEFIYIQTMERSSANSIKLRIQNINDKLSSTPISFDLSGLFSFIKSIKSIKEYNLSLVNPFTDNNLDSIKTSFDSIVNNNLFSIKSTPLRFNPIDTSSTKITLNPSEIKAIEIFY